MEMCRLISLERIFPFEDPAGYHIDKVDEIYSHYGHSSSDLSSCDDRKSSDKKSEHDRTRVTHKSSSRYIKTGNKKCYRNNNRKDNEKKMAIFLSGGGYIRKKELDRKTAEDDK